MSLLTDNEVRFVLDDMDVMEEFDVANFLSNTKSALTGNIEMVQMQRKVDHYSKALEEAIGEIKDITINQKEISEFLSNFKELSRLDNMINVEGIDTTTIGVIKPQYLNQYTTMLNTLIDKVLNDNIDKDEVDKYISGDAVEKVKRQVVTTSVVELSPAKLVKEPLSKDVALTGKYVKDTVIPFVLKAEKLKAALVAEATAITHSIEEAEDNMRAVQEAINRIKKTEGLSMDKVHKIDYIVYNGLRGYMDVLSYVTYMCIRKINTFASNVLNAEKIYNYVENYGSTHAMEGVMLDIFPTDTNNLGEDLEAGRASAYESIAKNLYEYHHSNPLMGISNGNLKSTGDILHSVFDMQMDFTGYPKKTYEDTIKMYTEISNGLDILAANSDDYLLIFEDLRTKAGFTIDLDTRFRSTLEDITDMTAYGKDVPGVTDHNIFVNCLAEVKDFPDNMEKIANACLDVRSKMDGIATRFDNNINGEFKDAEALNELKILMQSLSEQFHRLNKIVGANFMTRLRALGDKLTAITVKEEDPEAVKDVAVAVNLDTEDFRRECVEFEIEDKVAETEHRFELLQEAYILQRDAILSGAAMFMEADGDPAGDAENGDQGNTGNNDTKPTVVDNSTDNGSENKGILAKIIDIIKKFINTFITNLQRSGSKNTKWVVNNKQELLNRGYENVTVNMLPYNKLPYTQIIGKINEVTTVVRGLSPQAFQGLSTDQEAYSRVLSPISGGVSLKGSVSVQQQVINFFTTGQTGGAKVVAIANGDLQRAVASEMIPFCEAYAGQFSQNLQTALETLANAVDEAVEKATQGAAPNDTQNKNTAGNMAKSAGWVKSAIKDLTKGVLNAVKQRNNDYLKVLSSLVPKTPKQPVQPVPGPANNQNTAANNAQVQTTPVQAVQPAVAGA